MSIWDLDKNWARRKHERDGTVGLLVENQRHKFEDRFEDNMDKDVPEHPYKIYRNIVEENVLTDEETIVLEEMKDEYTNKWNELKQESVKEGVITNEQ